MVKSNFNDADQIIKEKRKLFAIYSMKNDKYVIINPSDIKKMLYSECPERGCTVTKFQERYVLFNHCVNQENKFLKKLIFLIEADDTFVMTPKYPLPFFNRIAGVVPDKLAGSTRQIRMLG